MKKYIINYNAGKGNVSLVRKAETRERAMQKVCKQYGWDEHITWLGENDWSDGIFSHNGKGCEFRIHEVKA